MANKFDYLGFIDAVDYSDQIKRAADAGDYKTAAILEQQRNNKIRTNGMDYEETNEYLSYLDEPSPSTAKFQPNGEADRTLSQLQNSSYDSFKKGDAYKDLYNSYERNGRLAMNDTLASSSARTGGLASSYAQQAAQQTYNSYLKQAEDAAYSRYNDELNKLYSLYEAQLGRENTEYNRYLDERDYNYKLSRDNYNDTQAAVSRAYQLESDAYNRGVYADETAYNRGRDAVSDARYDDETAYNRQQTADNIAYNRQQDALSREDTQNRWNYSVAQDESEKALAAANVQAAGGNFKGLADYYGVDEETARAYYTSQNGTATDAQQTAAMMEAAGGNYRPLADIFGVSEAAAKAWYRQKYGTAGSSGSYSGSSSKSGSSASETTDPYAGMSDAAVYNALYTKFRKNKTLTAEEFAKLESIGYTFDPESGDIVKLSGTAGSEQAQNKHSTVSAYDKLDYDLERAADRGASQQELENMIYQRGLSGSLTYEELQRLCGQYGIVMRNPMSTRKRNQ